MFHVIIANHWYAVCVYELILRFHLLKTMDLIKLTIIDCHKVWEWSKISLARMENYLAHRHTSVLTCDQWTTCILQHIYIFVNAFLLLHMLEFFIKNIQLRVVLFLFHLLQIFYKIFYIFLTVMYSFQVKSDF